MDPFNLPGSIEPLKEGPPSPVPKGPAVKLSSQKNNHPKTKITDSPIFLDVRFYVIICSSIWYLFLLEKYGESPFSIRKCRQIKAPGDSQLSFWNGEARYHLTSRWHNSGNFGVGLFKSKQKMVFLMCFFLSCLLGAIHACCLLFLRCFCCCCCCMFFFDATLKGNLNLDATKRLRLLQGSCCFLGVPGKEKNAYSHELCFWIAFWKGVSCCLNRKVGVSNKRFLGSANVRPFVQLQPFRNTHKSEKRRNKNTTCEESKEITKIDIDIWGRAYLAIIQLPVFEAENGIFNFSTIKNLNPPFFRDFTDQMLLTQNHHQIPYTVYLQNNIILLSPKSGGGHGKVATEKSMTIKKAMTGLIGREKLVKAYPTYYNWLQIIQDNLVSQIEGQNPTI